MLIILADAVKMLRGQGMPSFRHHDHGNLYIQFNVKFPETLTGPPGEDGFPTPMTKEQIAALESVLPPRAPQHIPPPDAMTEDYQLEKVDPTREGARASQRATGVCLSVGPRSLRRSRGADGRVPVPVDRRLRVSLARCVRPFGRDATFSPLRGHVLRTRRLRRED